MRARTSQPLIDRAITNSAQRLRQHVVQPQFAWIAELLDSNRHGLVAGGWLGTVGSEQTIPPRQIETEIAVGLLHHDRMVDAVHIRGNHNPSEPSINLLRQTDIPVIE